MSGWRLRWRERPHGPPVPVDGSRLLPADLCALPLAALKSLRIAAGRKERALDELFEVEALSNPGVEPLLAVEGSPRFERLGAGMASGRLEVDGDGGFAPGAGMSGGELVIGGGAGRLAGGGMLGGILRIGGDAGDEVGGPVDGAAAGMRGGEILVAGGAGRDAGLAMRRGLVVIGGAAGDCPGRHLRAGTIVVAQGELALPGIGMRRGSILALSGKARLAPGFDRDGRVYPGWVELLRARLDALGAAPHRRLAGIAAAGVAWESFRGDTLGLGRGEVLVAVD